MRRGGRMMTIGFRPYDNNVTATREGASPPLTFKAVNSIAKCNAVRKLSPKIDGRQTMAGTATMERPVDAKAAPVDQDVLIVGAGKIGRASCRERVCQYV